MIRTRNTSLVAVVVIVFCSANIFAIDCQEEIHPSYLKTDVPSLIHIKTEDDIERVRQNVINYLWKADGFPANKMPVKVTADVPKWMADMGVTDIIVGGIGQKAIDLFNSNGINVYIGAEVKNPKELANELLQGTLVSRENLCNHYGYHDHHH